MSKLAIDVENPKEESDANFTFSKDREAPSFGARQARVKPASPSDFNGD